MLTAQDLEIAEQLLLKLREVVKPAEPEFFTAGELPFVMHCSRTHSWACTKDPTFPRPIVLGRSKRLWRRSEVREWIAARQEGAKPNAAPEGGAGLDLDLTGPRRKRGEPTTDDRHGSPKRRRAQARAR
jgi:predicted DNA-binding transcriptional regulator AlpA